MKNVLWQNNNIEIKNKATTAWRIECYNIINLQDMYS